MIMRASLRTAAFLALAASAWASAAFGQAAFEKQIRHWRVTGIGGVCVASNRPGSERDSPYNSLYISRSYQGRWELAVFFWPGAFKEGAEIELTFDLGPAGAVTQRARESHDFIVRFELSAELREALAKAGKRPARVTATGVSRPLIFDLSDLAAVFAAFEDCAKLQR
jgi:hypothetical protein